MSSAGVREAPLGSARPPNDFCSPMLMPRAAPVQHISFGISPGAPSRTASAAVREEALQYASLLTSLGSPPPMPVPGAPNSPAQGVCALAYANGGRSAGTDGTDVPPFYAGDGDVPPQPPTASILEASSNGSDRQGKAPASRESSKDEISGLHYAYRLV